MRVVIAGAGIGGLALAAGLQRGGADVTVLERAPELHPVGAGISLFGNGFAALDALGLGAAVRAVAADGAGLTAGQRTPDGRWLTRTPPAAVASLRVVHRADLHRVLVDALAPGTVRLGTPVLRVGGDGRTVGTPAGTEEADVVVAADGLRSTVRAGLLGDPGARYAGYTAWRGVTAEPVDLRGAAGETWGRGQRFGIAPLPGGRVYWFATATAPAGERAADEHAGLVRRFTGWHEPVGELLAATPPTAVLRHDVHDLAGPLPTFRHGRCVLLGDAAHAMTPDLGQGGGQALEDAATLAVLLGGSADVDAALTEYDRLRRPRTQAIARRARTVGRTGQAAGALGSLRDAALRLVPPAVVGRQVLAVQDWRPPAARPDGART